VVVAQHPLSKSFWRRWSANPLLLRGARNPLLLLLKGQLRRGAGGGACRGGTGRHRQYPRCPNRDGGPVDLVSVDSSRVILDVVVVLD
jgi:hypothetical protein